jgi:hypothetical protein
VKVPRNGRRRPQKRPLRLIAEKGYDSDPLRKRLKEFKIDLYRAFLHFACLIIVLNRF